MPARIDQPRLSRLVTLAGFDGGGLVARPAPRIRQVFRRLVWPGVGAFSFDAVQGRLVARLVEAYVSDGSGEVDGVTLATIAGRMMRDVFAHHPAWGRLILYRRHRGVYRIADPR